MRLMSMGGDKWVHVGVGIKADEMGVKCNTADENLLGEGDNGLGTIHLAAVPLHTWR